MKMYGVIGMSLDDFSKEEIQAIHNSYLFSYEYEFKSFDKHKVAEFFLSHKDKENYCIESFDADADGEFISGSDFDTVDNFLENCGVDFIEVDGHRYVKKLYEAIHDIYIAVKESGDFIDKVSTIEEGIAMIRFYEEYDRDFGIFTEDFYELEDKDHNPIFY